MKINHFARWVSLILLIHACADSGNNQNSQEQPAVAVSASQEQSVPCPQQGNLTIKNERSSDVVVGYSPSLENKKAQLALVPPHSQCQLDLSKGQGDFVKLYWADYQDLYAGEAAEPSSDNQPKSKAFKRSEITTWVITPTNPQTPQDSPESESGGGKDKPPQKPDNPDNQPPSTPHILNIRDVGTDYVTIDWADSIDPDGAITGYEVSYKAGNNGFWTGTSTTDSTTYTFNNLQPNTAYTFRVRAKDDDDAWGDYINSPEIKTKALGSSSGGGGGGANPPQQPAKPSSLSISNRTLTFATQSGNSYQCSKDGGTNVSDCSSPFPFGNNAIASGKLCVRVKASGNAPASDWSCYNQAIAAANQAPSKPSTIQTSNVGADSITVSWTAATDSDGSIAGYQVSYKEGSNGWTGEQTTTQTTYTFSSLQSNTSYTFRVRAKDDDDAWSGYKESNRFGFNLKFKAISKSGLAKSEPSFAINEEGYLFSWGNNNKGQLGLGDTDKRTRPTRVGNKTYQTVSSGSFMALAIDTKGHLFSWGENIAGSLGLGGESITYKTNRFGEQYVTQPYQIGSRKYRLIEAAGISSFAISTSGGFYSWGYNGTLGHLALSDNSSDNHYGTQTGCLLNGINSKSDSNHKYYLDQPHLRNPSKTGNLTAISASITGSHVLAISSNGTISWGFGWFGLLEDSTTSVLSSDQEGRPCVGYHISVGNTKYQNVAAAKWVSFGIDSQGHLYSWGRPGARLGRSVPSSQIIMLPFNKNSKLASTKRGRIGNRKYKTITAYYESAFALDENGHLFAWGGFNGKSTPTQLGNEKYKKISNGLGIDENGFLWQWNKEYPTPKPVRLVQY